MGKYMNYPKILSLFGLFFDLLGVCLLLRNEMHARTKELKQQLCPPDADIQDYEASKRSEIRSPSLEEIDYLKHQASLTPESGLKRTKVGWLLVVLGFVLQFIGTSIS
jgi:hypothetical protein